MRIYLRHCRYWKQKVYFSALILSLFYILVLNGSGNSIEENCHTYSNLHTSTNTRQTTNVMRKPPSFMALTRFPYNIEESGLCSDWNNYLFVILVHSALDHFDRRANIRTTWANPRIFSDSSFKLVFLLGLPSNKTIQNRIADESNKHHDIVQGNFIDTYQNLTHKCVMGLRWLTENCLKTRFVVKVDDDVFLNTFKLVNYLTNDMKDKERHMYCKVRAANKSEICRDGTWAVPDDEYPSIDFWPFTYCPGFIVILTSDIIMEMYSEAKRTPFLWLDDVYLTGVLPSRIGHVTHIGLTHLNIDENKALDCFRSKKEPCDLFVTRAVSQGAMQELLTSIISIRTQYLM